jgi:predicted O-methyltransferase YrrM
MIVNPKVESYLVELRGSADGVRKEMESLANQKGFPIVGPEVGRLLMILARLSRASSIFELGSGYGYSAYWFAQGLDDGGTVHCTDFSEENRKLAQDFLGRAGLLDRINYKVGDALEIFSKTEGSFDIIFCDVDKQAYPETVELVLPRLKSGGLFITDNVLWRGNVAEPGSGDPTTEAIVQFNALTMGHPELDAVILPLRDGVSICMKK